MANKRPLPPMPKVHYGTYKHYKGDLYMFVMLVFNAEIDEWAVLYKPVGEHDKVFVRTVTNFQEEVKPGVPRFDWLGLV